MMNTSAFLLENYLPGTGLESVSPGVLQPQLRSDGENRGLWESASRLTLSLAPDGTQISRYDSSLYASFGHLLTADELQDTILSAFQAWAQHSSINVGLVSDSGEEFGTRGATQGDLRFGDIRIGAVPMAGDVFAVTVPHDDLMSGTWAGDVLFNSNADFTDADQFFAVALHEAGHVFGLDHSNDVTSVMHPTALNQALNADDILNLQSKYGVRALDLYDLNGNTNDTLESAVEIRNTGSIDGIIPLMVVGDIQNANDADYFRIRPNSKYDGSITFRLISSSVSLLRGRLTVLDDNGQIIGSVSETSNTGTDVSFQIQNVSHDHEYFAKIESFGSAENQFGSYALVTTIDDNLIQGYDLIDAAVRRNYGMLSQGEIQELFLSGLEGPFENDLHTNDTAATATILEQSPNAAAANDYRIQASIFSDTTAPDVDYYQVQAFDSVMLIRVNAMEAGGLISDIRVFDSSLQPIAGEIKVNGNGELLVEFQGIVPEADYFVAVAADRPGHRFDTGNYDLNVAFRGASLGIDVLGTGQLNNQNRSQEHTLYVARTQLFHFALTAINQATVPNSTIWMTVYDELGEAMYRVATRPTETRTAQSVLLRPGSYSIRVNVTVPAPISRRNVILAIPQIDYRIDGIGISDPTGPEVIDPADDPFAPCDPMSSDFCYPNGHHSPNPYVFIDEDEITLPNPIPGPVWQDANNWYWSTNWLG
jgi:hypothetical protein